MHRRHSLGNASTFQKTSFCDLHFTMQRKVGAFLTFNEFPFLGCLLLFLLVRGLSWQVTVTKSQRKAIYISGPKYLSPGGTVGYSLN